MNIYDFISALDKAGVLVSVEPAYFLTQSGLTGVLDEPEVPEALEVHVSSVTFNSMEASEGCLFVCKGVHFKAEYLEDALNQGASAYATEVSYGLGTSEHPEIVVSDVRLAMPIIAETFYGKVSDDLKVLGITGTKGKTTTTFFLKSILDDWSKDLNSPKNAICSGIINYDGVIEEESHLTTPEVLELYQHMSNAKMSGIEHLVMEVSSQSLKYNRVDGIEFEAGAFLNIGKDHISEAEHPDFDDYLESKLKLFGRCRKACYNLDCEEQDRIREAANFSPKADRIITFSRRDSSADVFAYDIKSVMGKVTFKVRADYFDAEFTLGTFGEIFVENALAAISLAVLVGVPVRFIQSGLAKAVSPGRMEVLRRAGGQRIAIVDYAHNQLSFEKLFETVREEFPGSKAVIVFGCSGGKAYPRREDLGSIAGKNAWKTIITEDDPGEEDVNAICSEIAGYVEAEGGDYEIIIDRTKAIKHAVELMDDNTILLLAGKGHETSIKRGTRWDEILSDAETFRLYTAE